MTIRDLLTFGTAELQPIALDESARDAEYLLAHTLGASREYILAHPDRALRGSDTAAYKTLIDRRRTGEPLSSITGQAWFYGLPFMINKHVLSPRPETELLVTLARAHYPQHQDKNTVAINLSIDKFIATEEPAEKPTEKPSVITEKPSIIIDVGTGSGCIAIALAKTLLTPPPIYAIDISPAALAVAEANATTHNVDHAINFLEGNLLEPLPRDIALLAQHKWIIGNLPYLPRAPYHANPILRHEPTVALAGGDDGLDVIRGLLSAMGTIAAPWTLFLEIDPAIKDALTELLTYHFPKSTPEIIRDLHGHERVCIVAHEA